METLDPSVFEQAMQRSVKSAGTQANTPATHRLRILEDGITVARLVCNTK
jgi:hypothetical protein